MNEKIQRQIESGAWGVCRDRRELPCEVSGECPYEYGPKQERNIEGMPLIDGDSRSCPTYGHVCPVFMEAFGLTQDDLEIRAILHCGLALKRVRRIRERTPNADQILAKYEKTMAKYPMADYPKYYV